MEFSTSLTPPPIRGPRATAGDSGRHGSGRRQTSGRSAVVRVLIRRRVPFTFSVSVIIDDDRETFDTAARRLREGIKADGGGALARRVVCML